VEPVQVPPEPAAGSWLRQLDVAHVDDRTGEEFLRCPAEPAKHEQRVLTRGRTARSQPRNRSSAERVIHALCVELRRLLPQLVRELVPAQPSITTLGVERGDERREVENGQNGHVRQSTTIDRGGTLRGDVNRGAGLTYLAGTSASKLKTCHCGRHEGAGCQGPAPQRRFKIAQGRSLRRVDLRARRDRLDLAVLPGRLAAAIRGALDGIGLPVVGVTGW
jgi:hypothetical protein